ncbi:MAG: hypothetical protein ACK46A_08815, partial [Akkermansiaceae bacterium]
NARRAVIPFEEFEARNDACYYYRDNREKSVNLITTARPVQESPSQANALGNFNSASLNFFVCA